MDGGSPFTEKLVRVSVVTWSPHPLLLPAQMRAGSSLCRLPFPRWGGGQSQFQGKCPHGQFRSKCGFPFLTLPCNVQILSSVLTKMVKEFSVKFAHISLFKLQ